MSKFNNPSRTLNAAPPLLGLRPAAPQQSPIPVFSAAPLPAVNQTPSIVVTGESPMVGIGFVLFGLLMISGYLNDWSFRLLGNKAYLSAIMLVLVPVAWVLSGNALKGFQDKIGVFWICFVGLIMIGVPFSEWRTGSLEALISYATRAFTWYFYVVAFVSTQRRFRSLMTLTAVCSGIVLLTCYFFGETDIGGDGRFRIPDSIFFANSNDLALQLVLGVTSLMILFYRGGLWRYLLAGIGILISLVYIVKTGSRGCLLSAILLYVAMIIVSKRRILLVLIALPVVAVVIGFGNQASLRRLTTVFAPTVPTFVSMEDASALNSAAQRQELIKKGISYTLKHPILGVGLLQFPVAVAGDAKKTGKFEPWLGTHNSYTEVSSECGIPAFLCYCSIIFLSFSRSYRMYRAASGKPQFAEIEGMAFCILSGVFVYAIATFFFHMAYTGLLPMLAGQTVALENIARPQLFPESGSRRA